MRPAKLKRELAQAKAEITLWRRATGRDDPEALDLELNGAGLDHRFNVLKEVNEALLKDNKKLRKQIAEAENETAALLNEKKLAKELESTPFEFDDSGPVACGKCKQILMCSDGGFVTEHGKHYHMDSCWGHRQTERLKNLLSAVVTAGVAVEPTLNGTDYMLSNVRAEHAESRTVDEVKDREKAELKLEVLTDVLKTVEEHLEAVAQMGPEYSNPNNQTMKVLNAVKEVLEKE